MFFQLIVKQSGKLQLQLQSMAWLLGMALTHLQLPTSWALREKPGLQIRYHQNSTHKIVRKRIITYQAIIIQHHWDQYNIYLVYIIHMPIVPYVGDGCIPRSHFKHIQHWRYRTSLANTDNNCCLWWESNITCTQGYLYFLTLTHPIKVTNCV